jgi:hypothetical protein
MRGAGQPGEGIRHDREDFEWSAVENCAYDAERGFNEKGAVQWHMS